MYLTEGPRTCMESTSDAAIPFWKAIHGSDRGNLVLTSGFRIGRSLHGLETRRFAWPGESPNAIEWVVKQNCYGRDVYQAPMLEDRPGQDSLVSCIGVDVNNRILNWLPEPTISIETSPGRKQIFWKLDQPVSRTRAKELMNRLNFVADGTASYPSGFRIPGTVNFKHYGSFVCNAEITDASYSPSLFDDLLPEVDVRKKWPEKITDSIERLALSGRRLVPGEQASRLQGALAAAAAMVLAIGTVAVAANRIISPSSVRSGGAQAISRSHLDGASAPSTGLSTVRTGRSRPGPATVALSQAAKPGQQKHTLVDGVSTLDLPGSVRKEATAGSDSGGSDSGDYDPLRMMVSRLASGQPGS